MRVVKVVLSLLILSILAGCSPSDKYCEFVLDSPYFRTEVSNRTVFDKCFIAYTLRSYRDKSDHQIYVCLSGKFMLANDPHSAEVFYQFTDKEHYTITDFIIDGQSEPEVFFLYYMSQLYGDLN